jgi:hypothetical protein
MAGQITAINAREVLTSLHICAYRGGNQGKSGMRRERWLLENISIKIVEIRGKQVRLGIDAPVNLLVLMGEEPNEGS